MSPSIRKYRHPPIVEVAAEIHFDPLEQWDPALVGLLSRRLSDLLPVRETAKVVEAEIQTSAEGIFPRVTHTERSIFKSKLGDAAVQIGPKILSIHRVPPYHGWDTFLPFVRRTLSDFTADAGIKTVSSLILRYTNRVTFPKGELALEKYFAFHPGLGGTLPQTYGPFFMSVNWPADKSGTTLRVDLTTAPPDKDEVAVFLNLSVFNMLRRPGSPDEMAQWMDGHHAFLNKVFEGCLTDELRTKFEEIK